MGKGKTEIPFSRQPDHHLVGKPVGFPPPLCWGWLGLGHAFLFGLDVRQEGRVVRKVLKIGMDQQICGFNHLVTWFGQHCHSLKTRNLGGFIPGTPAI